MASISTAMRQICSRNVSYQIEMMEWSRKMDLIAITCKGDTIIHRFKWQKVWSHPAPEEGLRVKAIAWRNDEKVIAIGYSNGLVHLLDIESHEVVHTFKVGAEITCMCWSNCIQPLEVVQNEIDDTAFLTTLPNLNSMNARKHGYNYLRFYSENQLNLLVIGTVNGLVRLSAFGMLTCGEIDCRQHFSDATVQEAKIAPDLKQLFVVVARPGDLQLLIFDTEVLAKYSFSLLNVATQHGLILNNISYISDTIQSIVEAWETVLLEMDNKLRKYADSMPPNESLSADFLELLMFGYPSSPALFQFLTKELTSKGLKKLGSSIDLSYSTIQKLVVKSLTCGILNVLYHLSCLKGMSRNQYYYKDLLGKSTEAALSAAGSFFIKAKELQQTIDTSTRDYKIFFRWLYSVIIRLMEESVPEDTAGVRQQEVNYLAEFIKNFDDFHEKIEDGDTVKRKFNLERVGQYLLDKDLVFPVTDVDPKSWESLLAANKCLAANECIFNHHKTRSLVQEFNALERSINDAFQKPNQTLGNELKLSKTITLEPLSLEITQTYLDGIALFAVRQSEKAISFIEMNAAKEISGVKVLLADNFTFRHIQFYNEHILSILLRAESKVTTFFMQYPVQKLRELCQPFSTAATMRTVNGFQVIDENLLKPIEGIDGHLLAVSGSRKVASLLSESRKTIRIYETEVDEDDEEPLDTSSLNASMEN